jgi:serine/threonine-protein kinase
MLTNRKPFSGKTADELKTAIRTAPPRSVTSVRTISQGLEQAILKAFEKDPAARYQNAAEFSAALGPYYQSEIGTPLGIAAVVRGLFPAFAGTPMNP